ncbi:hypothetical protein M434DRAFT_402448 [Hypoxylon sp. CO27-5]|nr:hypothetical protein M434DRAFT_402448 [Hypoxylon sp. CO27-5]
MSAVWHTSLLSYLRSPASSLCSMLTLRLPLTLACRGKPQTGYARDTRLRYCFEV